MNNHAHVLQAKEITNNKFICQYFNSLNLSQFVTGTAQPKLTQANMNKIKIPISSSSEQHRIVSEIESRLSVCDKIEEAIEDSLLKAEALRLSIIKKGFEGKLVKQNPKDESAEILLEKIRAEIKKNNPDKPKKQVTIKTRKKK